jgi:hypothetical protein
VKKRLDRWKESNPGATEAETRRKAKKIALKLAREREGQPKVTAR